MINSFMKKMLMTLILLVGFIIFLPVDIVKCQLWIATHNFVCSIITCWKIPGHRLFWTENGRQQSDV